MQGAMRGVIDPELGDDLVDLGMYLGCEIDADGTVTVQVALTTAGCPLRAQLQRDVTARVGSLPGVTEVHVRTSEMSAGAEEGRSWPGPAAGPGKTRRPPRSRAGPGSWPSRRARAGSASRRSRSTWPPAWRHGASRSGCSTPTSPGSRCPGCSAWRGGSRPAGRTAATGPGSSP